MKRQVLLTFMLLSTIALQAASMKPFELPLWPNGPKTAGSDAADVATVTVYLPDAKTATGRAVVCCPGGAYSHLAVQHEGTDWATFFNQQGIALIVLKYRMPHGVWTIPAEDAEEAVRLVRRNAADWHINASDIGIMGFSAGGHLASTIATHSTGTAAVSFQILFYPVISMEQGVTHQGSRDNLLGKSPKRKLINEYCNEQHVTASTPRAFMALADDDRSVPALNSVEYYEALCRNRVPASMHIYPSGGHGFGLRQSFPYHLEMLLELRAWLKSF